MPRKCAVITFGKWSGINASVLYALSRHFSDFEVVHVDALSLVKKKVPLLALNLLQVWIRYGRMLLLRRWRLRYCYFRTPYFFTKARELLTRHLAAGEYAFSIQTMSIYDASTPDWPHFVYTDHVERARDAFPDAPEGCATHDRWIELEASIYRNAAMVFTFSSHVSNSLLEDYGLDPQRVACVRAGSNLQIDADGIDEDRFETKNILFVGKDWQRKGGPELLAAFEIVRRAHPDAQLTIVGCSPRVDVPNCSVVGRVPREAVHRYFQKASVFCLPSRLEPFGIVFVEAMQYQLPIVATRLGAVPDLVIEGETGYTVDVGDVDRLALVLIDLLDDPQKCRRFGQRALETAQTKYNWDRVGATIREHVLSVMGNPDAARAPLDRDQIAR